MKRTLFFTLTIIIAMALVQCEKEGPRGKTGPAGKDGNANVTTYLITDSAKIAWKSNNEIQLYYDSVFFIPDSILSGGMILVYKLVELNNMWYHVPGLGYGGLYNTRSWISSGGYFISAANPDGTYYSGTPLPQLVAVKIVLVPASTLIQIRKSGYEGDFSDHDEAIEILTE